MGDRLGKQGVAGTAIFHFNEENKIQYSLQALSVEHAIVKTQYSSLAQSVEHAAVNRRVVGSSPTGGAKKKRHTESVLFLFVFYVVPKRRLYRIKTEA